MAPGQKNLWCDATCSLTEKLTIICPGFMDLRCYFRSTDHHVLVRFLARIWNLLWRRVFTFGCLPYSEAPPIPEVEVTILVTSKWRSASRRLLVSSAFRSNKVQFAGAVIHGSAPNLRSGLGVSRATRAIQEDQREDFSLTRRRLFESLLPCRQSVSD